MLNKIKFCLIAWVYLGIPLFCLYANVGQNERKDLSREEVLALLPLGLDMLDFNEIAKYQALVSLGEQAHPILADYLDEITDPILISRILAVFVEGSGDKSFARLTVKKLLSQHHGLQTKASNDIKVAAITCIGRIANPDDTEAILPFLDDANESVRINTIRTISKIGLDADMAHIQKFYHTRRSKLTLDEIRRDFSLKEAEKVLKTRGVPYKNEKEFSR